MDKLPTLPTSVNRNAEVIAAFEAFKIEVANQLATLAASVVSSQQSVQAALNNFQTEEVKEDKDDPEIQKILRNSLSASETTTSILSSLMESFTGYFAQINNRLTDTDRKLDALDDSIASVRTTVTQPADDVQVTQVATRLDQLISFTENRAKAEELAQVDATKRFEALERKIDAVDERASSYSDYFSQTAQQISGVESAINSVISTATSDANDAKAANAAMEAQIEELQLNVNTTTEAVNSLAGFFEDYVQLSLLEATAGIEQQVETLSKATVVTEEIPEEQPISILPNDLPQE